MRPDLLKLFAISGMVLVFSDAHRFRSDAAEGDGVKPPVAADDQLARELGRKVLAIQQVLKNPKAPGAMRAITDLGHDSRHYVMVRGWLVQELAGATSIRDANQGKAGGELDERITFLRKAIRAIDLE